VTRELLVPELASVAGAAIVPLDRSVEEVLEALAAEGSLVDKRWLSGFPHHPGANGHRARIFAQNRESLTRHLKQILGPFRHWHRCSWLGYVLLGPFIDIPV
jgi:hypothetical protein